MLKGTYRYVVTGAGEEFECPECGGPRYSGDYATMCERLDKPFCSTACVGKGRDRAKQDGEWRNMPGD